MIYKKAVENNIVSDARFGLREKKSIPDAIFIHCLI